MTISLLSVFGIGIVPSACLAQSAPEIQARRIAAYVKFLASDLLEGRGVGTRGGQLAEEYLAATLASFGVKPGGENGTYFQRVPMVGVSTLTDSKLTAARGGKSLELTFANDFVASIHKQVEQLPLDAELVFIGHGIVAPEEKWNDYKTDVRGKIVVVFTNEPQPGNPQVFKGKTLTYKGRWTYKFEEAARQGALGALIIHTTPTAGYGWNVVRTSWSKEDPQMKLDPSQPSLGFAGWMTEECGDKLLAMAGHSVESLLKASDSRDFNPIPLGIRLKGQLRAKIRPIESRNVVGIVPGGDAKLKDDAVIFSAHWDHLGIGTGPGDQIYNGASDNATGCAMVLEIARVWAGLEHKPRRSALFLFVTAEESGLRGSEYYGLHPLVPAGRTVLNLNFDGFFPVGRTRDVVVTGAERTTAWPLVEEAAQRFGYEIQPDPRPEQGSYYRSDHFSLARAGIPAFSIKAGSQVIGKPASFSEEYFREYNAKHYHQPSDEVHDDWDFSGMEHLARFGFLIGLNAANTEQMFTWKEGDEFLAARQASGVR
ncbi:MAG TPA: M28 family peptidase [Bryobacteraceae bacterium]|nr:M28 family peptidase [Bryobacteraceae bacterium]